MDFASLMSAQISKAKSSAPTPSESKYQRRADLEAQRKVAYAAEQAKIEAEREGRLAKKRKLEEDEGEHNLQIEEKKRKLAEESKLRKEEEERKQESLRRKRLGLPEKPIDSSSQDDIPSPDGSALTTKPKLYPGPIPTTLEPVPEFEQKMPSSPAATPLLHRQLSTYYNHLLAEWSHSLSHRPSAVKTSSSGLAAQSIHTTCLASLRPFFTALETGTLDHHILIPIANLVRAAQERRYVDANDIYLTLSIGKAAWPIGVTMVGIHERSAREKLSETDSDKQAHIMADEGTRKYLQSVKRCLSFAQVRWPPGEVEGGQIMG